MAEGFVLEIPEQVGLAVATARKPQAKPRDWPAGTRIVSADSHMLEPDLWVERFPPQRSIRLLVEPGLKVQTPLLSITIYIPEFAAREVVQFQMIVGVNKAGVEHPAFKINYCIVPVRRFIKRHDSAAIKAQGCRWRPATIRRQHNYRVNEGGCHRRRFRRQRS